MKNKTKSRRLTSREVTDCSLKSVRDEGRNAWLSYNPYGPPSTTKNTLQLVNRAIKNATKVAERLRKEIENG